MVRTLPGALQFIFEDPHASRVEIHATGPDGLERSWPMTAGDSGRWTASVQIDRDRDARFDLRYLVDDRFWVLDPGIRTIVRDELGHCRSRLADL